MSTSSTSFAVNDNQNFIANLSNPLILIVKKKLRKAIIASGKKEDIAS